MEETISRKGVGNFYYYFFFSKITNRENKIIKALLNFNSYWSLGKRGNGNFGGKAEAEGGEMIRTAEYAEM